MHTTVACAQVSVVWGEKMTAGVERRPPARHRAEDCTDTGPFKSFPQLWGRAGLHFAEEKGKGE